MAVSSSLEARQPKASAEELGFEPIVFARSFIVPSTIDATKVAAKLDMGVLKVHLPKSEACQAAPHRGQVRLTSINQRKGGSP